MASIHFRKSKGKRKTYHMVLYYVAKHKWIKAGTLADAKKLRKHVEELTNSERMEKLGLTSQTVRIDDFFQRYSDHIVLHNSPATHKRYKAALNAFLAFLRLFHPTVKYLAQITPDLIEGYQKQRLESVDLKIEADGGRFGTHRNKRLPLPQTVNFEVGVLGSVFIWAHEKELIPKVPTKKVKRLKPVFTSQKKILSPAECAHFLKTAKAMAKSDLKMLVYCRAFKFMLNTGLRSSELCHLTWDDVELESGLIKI